MDKKIIKDFLTDRFVNEAKSTKDTPGISVTKAMREKSGKENKAGIKNIEDNLKDYDKSVKKQASDTKNMPQNKFNYNDENEQTYHQQMEIMNGQEMIEFDREPNKMYKDRAIMAIEGGATMGNSPEWANVVPAQQGFTGPEFGKNLVKAIKASHDKRQNATDRVISFGDDIETVPKGSRPIARHSAYNLSENENKINNKPQIQKESMKRLKFKQEFNGVGNALKMIPESYRVDNKEFEMTDGNESYRIRWEGTLSEGKAIVLQASDKNMINEDMQKMKHLMGYKSQDTLGLVKGKSRIEENATFGKIWDKTKMLMESEDIEGKKAPEKKTDEKKPQAADAKKHVEGSVSTDKGTKAPAPKKGSMESLDDAKKQAPEAKKHVHMGEGAGDAKIGMGLGQQHDGEGEWDQIDIPQAAAHGDLSKTTYAPAPKTGEWDKVSVPQAADAKKHVHMNEGVELGGIKFEPINVDELFGKKKVN